MLGHVQRIIVSLRFSPKAWIRDNERAVMCRFLGFIYAERLPSYSDLRPHVRVLVRLINCQTSVCRYRVEVSRIKHQRQSPGLPLQVMW